MSRITSIDVVRYKTDRSIRHDDVNAIRVKTTCRVDAVDDLLSSDRTTGTVDCLRLGSTARSPFLSCPRRVDRQTSRAAAATDGRNPAACQRIPSGGSPHQRNRCQACPHSSHENRRRIGKRGQMVAIPSRVARLNCSCPAGSPQCGQFSRFSSSEKSATSSSPVGSTVIQGLGGRCDAVAVGNCLKGSQLSALYHCEAWEQKGGRRFPDAVRCKFSPAAHLACAPSRRNPSANSKARSRTAELVGMPTQVRVVAISLL